MTDNTAREVGTGLVMNEEEETNEGDKSSEITEIKRYANRQDRRCWRVSWKRNKRRSELLSKKLIMMTHIGQISSNK